MKRQSGFWGILALAAAIITLFAVAGIKPFSRANHPRSVTNYVFKHITNTVIRVVTNPPPTSAAKDLFDWSMIESDDLKIFVENLRALGCPEERIRHLIVGEINERFATRRDALNARNSFKYWQAETAPDGQVSSREIQRKLRALKKEQYALVKELLGIDLREEIQKLNGRETLLDRIYGPLSEEKRKMLARVHNQYDELEAGIYEEGDGEIYPEDDARLQELEEKRTAEIKQLLNEEEWREYQLRNSPLAHSMRQGLAGWEILESEFRSIFQWRETFETDHGSGMEFLTSEKASARAAARQQMNEQIEILLGEDRFAQYERGQTYDFQELYKLARRYLLPREAAIKAYEINQALEVRRQEVETQAGLSEGSRRAALTDLEEEVEKKLREVLGEKAYKAYQHRGAFYTVTPADPAIVPMEIKN